MEPQMIQTQSELDQWYDQDDPWDYENSLEDRKRKDILLHEIPEKAYLQTLDIGAGHGFITRDLPGKEVIGVDLAKKAIQQAKKARWNKPTKEKKFEFYVADLFQMPKEVLTKKFDLIVITGVLYPQYIGESHTLVYHIIDQLLNPNGILVSVHISEWYKARFPYLMLKEYHYPFLTYTHQLEVYSK